MMVILCENAGLLGQQAGEMVLSVDGAWTDSCPFLCPCKHLSVVLDGLLTLSVLC